MQRFMRQKRHLGHISTHFWHGSRPVVIEPSYDFYDVHVHDCSVLGKLEKIEKSSLFLSFFIFSEF
tara:strand:+ start:203 stop:400 length:198 start_codon:yes stop_codon:yes gene_type:complete